MPKMNRTPRYEPRSYDPESSEVMQLDDDGEWVRWEDVPSWDCLMDILDAVYPASVFTGESGDLGPGIIKRLREIDEIRKKSC